jgi:hypothetical protein
MELPQPPIVIRESRWEAAALALVSAFLIWGCALSIAGPKPAWGYVGVLLFGAGGLIAAAQLVRPSTLTLDPSGFRVDQLWRSWHVRWEQASNFHIGYQSRGFTRYVTYDYAPDRPAWGGLNRWGQLPPYWRMSPPELVELMTQCKARWGGAVPTPAREPTVS